MAEDPTLPHRTEGTPLRALEVEVLEGPERGTQVAAPGDRLAVGTATDNDLVLSDRTVSRYHLELHRVGDRIEVIDHGSTNGTELGGALLRSASIRPGTALTLGRTTLRVTDGAPVVLETHDQDRFGRLRGRDPEMRRVMAVMNRAAKSEASILVLGETGTGKEVIAHAIHDASPRASKPFETVDCGALLPTLIASELFGHERGAFTGADHQHIGAFERADGGTLFLDEIGELPAGVQAALLGALERRSFKRLGGSKTVSVDVRVIAATHRDLRAEVNSGAFRQDLYYRVAVVLLRVPPLRERPQDIPILIEHFLEQIGGGFSLEALFPPAALDVLKTHHWPGNVRELRNFVDAAVALGVPPALEPDSMSASDEGDRAELGSADPAGAFGKVDLEVPYSEARAAVIQGFEKAYLQALIASTKGNVAMAARKAKMDRSYLIIALKRNGLKVRRES